MTSRPPAHDLSRPPAAAAASLAAVSFFIVVLGVVFLPKEAERLSAPHFVSVTHFLVPEAGRPAVSLYWTISPIGTPGWKHHLAVHSPGEAARRLEFAGLTVAPLSLASGPDADHVLVGNWDGSIHMVDLREGGAPPVVVGRQEGGGVVALAWSARGQCVLSQTAFGFCGWDLAERRELWRRDDIAPYCFGARIDSPTAIVSTLRGEIIELDLHDGHTARSLAHFDLPILGIAIDDRQERLAVLRGDGRMVLFDCRTGVQIWAEGGRAAWHTASGRFASFSPCGNFLVSSDPENPFAMAVWNITTGQRLQTLQGHQKVVHGAAFTASGELCSWSADGTIRTWDIRTGARRQVATLAAVLPSI